MNIWRTGVLARPRRPRDGCFSRVNIEVSNLMLDFLY
jgi:hypothetical protein